MKLGIQLSFTLLWLLFSNLSLANNIVIEDSYIRAIPPGQTNSAAFMTLTNSGNSSLDLISASSTIAKNVELHEHRNENGMMKMRQVKKISIAANSKTELKPGGYHVMLIGLNKEIKPNDMIKLSLKFSNGSQQTITSKVKNIMAGMMKNKVGKKSVKKVPDTQILFNKHTNPMPNLMAVINTFSDDLKLSDKQKNKLKQWKTERTPITQKIAQSILSLEADIHAAIIKDEELSRIDQLADGIMQNRIKLIRSSALGRENMKRILDAGQYKKVLDLYTANFISKH